MTVIADRARLLIDMLYGRGPGLILRGPFPFAYTSPGIGAAGLAVYTPTSSDVLYDGWIEVDTVWDGTAPVGELKLLSQDEPLVAGQAQDMTIAGSGMSLLQLAAVGPGGVPTVFASNDPVAVKVPAVETTQALFTDGSGWMIADNPTQAAYPSFGGAGITLPWTVVAEESDLFVWVGSNGYAEPETFTVAPGTYTTAAEACTALNIAVGQSSEAFSTKALFTDNGDGTLTVTCVQDFGGLGTGDNLYSSPTHDALTALWITLTPPDNALTLIDGCPAVVVEGAQDQLRFVGQGGDGTPIVFTVAPGQYATAAEIAVAMAAAVDSHGSPLSDIVSIVRIDDLNIQYTTLVDIGEAGNGDAIYSAAPGRDMYVQVANEVFTPTSLPMSGGTGSPPSQGSGRVYLVTGTPFGGE